MADSPDPEVVFRTDMGESEAGQGDVIYDEGPIDGREDSREDISIEREGHGYAINNRKQEFNDDERFHFHARPSMQPTPYSGSDDWDEYISHFENCAELGRWSDRDKILALSASLRGAARTFYISLSVEEKHSYLSLVGKLGQRFGSTRQQNRWLSRFEARKRQPGESIAVLGDSLRQMAQKAYSNLDAVAQETIALNQLYKAISLDMKCRCMDRECKTVAEAVDVIERYEAVIGDSNAKRSIIRGVAGLNDQSEETSSYNKGRPDPSLENTLKQVMEKLDKIEMNNNSRWEKKPQSQPFKSRSCFICHSVDHFFRKCPIYQKCQNQMEAGISTYKGANTQQTQYKQQGNSRPSAH